MSRLREDATIEYKTKLPAILIALLLAVCVVPATLATQSADEADGLGTEDASTDFGEPDEDGFYVDPVNGRFKIDKVPNIEGTYRWVSEDTIAVSYGMQIEVVQHNEEWLWIRLWEPGEKKAPVKPQTDEASEEARKQEIAESYRTELESGDRLELQGFENGLPTSGQWRQGFDIADMNADGHLDLIFGPARKSTRPQPNIFLGDSKGNWRRWSEARFPAEPFDYGDVAVGDLNGDGHLDMVFGIHLRGVLALVGDGKGGFETWTEGIGLDRPGTGEKTAFSSRAIELVDWNQDGRLDILAFGEGPKGRGQESSGGLEGQVITSARGLVAFVNNGDGTWTPEFTTDRTRVSYQFGDGFALGDFTGDGRDDVALAGRQMNNNSILGLSTDEGIWQGGRLDVLRPRAFIGGVTAADLDGDGASELFLGFQSLDRDEVWRTGIDIYSTDNDFTWQLNSLFAAEGRSGIYSVDTGDLDGDGHLDVVALTGYGEVLLFLGNGEGVFTREHSPELPETVKGCRGYGLRLHDLDGDDRLEVIASFSGEEGGLRSLPEFYEPGCERGGSIRVWQVVAKASPSSDTAAVTAASESP